MLDTKLTVTDVSLGLGDSFEKRLERLRAGAFRIAYYYDLPDESTFRYRVYNMIQVIELNSAKSKAGALSACWFCLRDGKNLNVVVDNCDVIIFVRARYSGIVANAICRAKMRGRKIVYDTDDLVIDPSLIPLIVSTLDQNANDENVWQYWFQYVSRLRAVLMECDSVIATNSILAQNVSASTGKYVGVLKNFYNLEQEQISSRIRAHRSSDPSSNRTSMRIGYFSGSPSHNNDFAIVAGSLLKLMEENNKIELVIAGFLDLGPKFKKFSHRIDRLPMMNFGPLQQSIASVHLNISPLQCNIFTASKSELKFFEASLVNTPTLASNVGSFSKAISNRENGWLAEPHTWTCLLNEIEHCYRYEREFFNEIQRKSLESARIRFSYSVMFDLIHDLLVGS